jgi:23S rRNA (uracil1939-C5)-methyltransferase
MAESTSRKSRLAFAFASTFFQTNSAQAERLVEVVKALAGDVAGAHVVDVYCGVGLFSLVMAAAGAQVTGVEIVETAVEAARRNATENGLTSLVFHAGDARKVLAEVLPAALGPKLLLLDPPRAGAGGKVMRRIARACPERIVYVSCNPTTLARDLMELRPFGYQITAVQPIDMFPQTYHVETVVALERISATTTDTCNPSS